MSSLLHSLDPGFVAFTAILGAAAGADLALALLVLGVLPQLGWSPAPGSLALLQSPVVLGSVVLLYLAEWVMERHPGGFALWHTFQRWVRVLGLFLLGSLATTSVLGPERILLISVLVLLGMGVYVGASGWEAILLLRRPTRGSNRLTAVAIDIAFAALLALALEDPIQALVALVALLLVASIQLPVTYRAHLAMVRAGKAWLNALLLPGKWVPEAGLPAAVRRAVASDGPVPGKPLRGARATLLTRSVRAGWLVLTPGGAMFVAKGRPPLPVRANPEIPGYTGALHARKPVLVAGQEGELLIPKDGPRIQDLDQEVT
jgi:hypothetical protein